MYNDLYLHGTLWRNHRDPALDIVFTKPIYWFVVSWQLKSFSLSTHTDISRVLSRCPAFPTYMFSRRGLIWSATLKLNHPCHVSFNLSNDPSISPTASQSDHPSFYPFIHMSACPSVCLPSAHLLFYTSTYLFICPFVHLPIYPPVLLSILASTVYSRYTPTTLYSTNATCLPGR